MSANIFSLTDPAAYQQQVGLSKHPTPASFVRPNRPTDRARSFTDAVNDKYAYDEDSSGLGLKPVWISGKEAEEVGFDKIRQKLANLHALRVVIVDGLCIQRPQARRTTEDNIELSSDVWSTCPKITDLDVSRNLLEHWDEVIDIVRQLPSLQTLRADGNRYASTTTRFSSQVLQSRPFTHLKSLCLEDTLLPWHDVSTICTSFPHLVSLSAAGNQYIAVSPTQLPGTLDTINMERNNLESLASIAPLSPLRNLQQLSLKSNRIYQLGSDPAVFSGSLSYLDLSYNRINSWSLIDALNNLFPGLTSLRVAHNPLFDALKAFDGRELSAADGYMLTIARIGRLKTLNFSSITAKERLNAEIYYLSSIAKELAATPAGEQPEILARNPRYKELCDLHGDPLVQAPKETLKVNERSIAARLIILRVKLTAEIRRSVSDATASRSLEDGVLQIEVPKGLSIYSILGLIAKELDLRPLILKLIWETEEEDARETTVIERDSDVKGAIKYREETLAPKSRQLSTWIQDAEAKFRIEYDAATLDREAVVARRIGTPSQ